MAEVVVDSSALTEILVGAAPDIELRRRILLSNLAAPELIDLETSNVLQRLLRRGRVHQEQADRAMSWLETVPVARSSHRMLIRRVWELRHSITAYDAAYVALAEELGVPLVTCDAKLAGSNGHEAKIELYPAS